MPRTRFDWIVVTIAFALVGGAWTIQSRVPASAINPVGKPPAPQIGYLAPDFTATTIAGEAFQLSAVRGRPVVLNFWATWCPPCRAEIPHLESAWRERGGAVMFVGVDVGESPGQVAAFAEEFGMTYPVPLDPRSEIARLYHVVAFPSTFLIDSDGVIRDIDFGAVNKASLDAALGDLISNP